MKLLRKIYGFAESKRRLEIRLSDAVDRIQEHLIKCLVYHDSDSLPHWKSEIRGFFPRIKKLSGSNKYPSAKFIFNNTWMLVEDTSDDMYLSIIKWYPDLTPNNVTPGQVYKLSEDFFIWWSNELSTTGVIELSKLSNKVDELITRSKT